MLSGIWKFLKTHCKYSILYTLTLIVITAAYVVANSTISIPFWFDKVIVLATSPFNSGIEMQYLNNIGFAFLELALVEIYFTSKNRRRLVKWCFILAIASSYMVAAVSLKDTNSPSAGSSIMVADFLTIAFLALIYDLILVSREAWNNRRTKDTIQIGKRKVNRFDAAIMKALLYVLVIIVIPPFFYGLLLIATHTNPISPILHIIGVAFFLVLLGLFWWAGRFRKWYFGGKEGK